jgi:hypothetical protein
VLEIGVRTSDPDTIALGLDMADRLVAERSPVSLLATPLYWLQTNPVFPALVLPRLDALAGYEPLRDDVERVRASYVAAHGSPNDRSSYLSRAELQTWADARDELLVGLALDHALARSAHGLETLPPVLETTLLATAVEVDVLNGGYNQYFWNNNDDDSALALHAFDVIGANTYAQLHREALTRFRAHEPQLGELRRADTPQSFSASYDLNLFDELDDRFVQLYDTNPLTTILTEWLAQHLNELADALGITEAPKCAGSRASLDDLALCSPACPPPKPRSSARD